MTKIDHVIKALTDHQVESIQNLELVHILLLQTNYRQACIKMNEVTIQQGQASLAMRNELIRIGALIPEDPRD